MNEILPISTPSSIGQPAIVVVRNPLTPEVLSHEFIQEGLTVTECLADQDLTSHPTLVLLNTRPLLEKDWDDTVIQWGDVITLVREPGFLFTTTTWLIIGLVLTAISTAYSLYTILTLDIPDPGDQADSPNYSISFRGNKTRPNEPIPVVYGTVRTYPDYTGKYSTYIENEQWLYQIFDIGMGEFENIVDADVFYEDTALTNFDEYFIETVPPGATSSIFPSNEQVSTEVEGIELIDTNYTNYYTVNSLGTTVTEITFDISAPSGMYQLSDKGRYRKWSVKVDINWRMLGSGTGTTTSVTIPYSNIAARHSFSFIVPEGRYEARVRRQTEKSNATWKQETIMWERVRGTEPDKTVTETTRLAIKVRASQTLGNQSLSKMNVLVKRKLNVWNGSSYSSPTQTNSAAQAFIDIARADYGGKNPDKRIDLAGLLALDQSVEFNGIFDSKGTLWDAMNEIARVFNGRAVEKHGGVLGIALDEEGVAPSAMYTMRNIIADSFTIEHNMSPDDAVNFVRATFKNKDENYRETSVDCVPSGITPGDPYEIRLRGITDGALAYDVGLRLANESRWRRKRVGFETGVEGFIPSVFDTIRVAHYQVGLEQSAPCISGEVRSNAGNTLTVYEDLSSLVGQGSLQCYLKDKDGSPWGPTSCTVTASTITLGSTPPAGILVYGTDHAGPMFAVGQTSDFMLLCKVTKVTQSGANTVQIESIVDNPNAYIGDDPPTYSPLLPQFDISPKITDFRANLIGDGEDFEVKLVWNGTFADYYLIDMSLDSGSTWEELGRTANNYYQVPVPYLDGIQLRVRGVAVLIGKPAIAIINVISGGISYPGIHNLHPLSAFTGSTLSVAWNAPKANTFALIEFIATGTGANNTVMHSDRLPAAVTNYTLTWEMLTNKYTWKLDGYIFPLKGSREITVRLTATAQNQDGTWGDSPQSSEITLINDQMGGLYNVKYAEKNRTLDLMFDWPITDYAGVEVHMSTTSGFTPGTSTLKYRGPSNSISLAEVLNYPETYYLKMAGFDIFGPDDTSQLDWSTQETISTTDDSFAGDIEWDDILDGNGTKPEDNADQSPPGIVNHDPNFDALQTVGFGVHWMASTNIYAWDDGNGVNGMQMYADGSYQLASPVRRYACQKGDSITVKARMLNHGCTGNQVSIRVLFYDQNGTTVQNDDVGTMDGLSQDVFHELSGSVKATEASTRTFRAVAQVASSQTDPADYVIVTSLRSIVGTLQEWEDVTGPGRPEDGADQSPPGIINHDPNFDKLNTLYDWDYHWTRSNYPSNILKWDDGNGINGVRMVPNGQNLSVYSVHYYDCNGLDTLSMRVWGQQTGFSNGANMEARLIIYDANKNPLSYPTLATFSGTPSGTDQTIVGFYRVLADYSGTPPMYFRVHLQVRSDESSGSKEAIFASCKVIQGGYQEWADILESEGKPVDYADVTRDNLGGDGVNRVPPVYASFWNGDDDIPYSQESGSVDYVETLDDSGLFGDACLHVRFNDISGNEIVYFPSTTEYPVLIDQGEIWIISFWAACGVASNTFQIKVKGRSSGIISTTRYANIQNMTTDSANFTTSSVANTWKQYVFSLDLSGTSDRALMIYFEKVTSGIKSFYVDGLFVERMQSDHIPTLEDWSGFSNSLGRQTVVTSHLVEDATQSIYLERLGSDIHVEGSVDIQIFNVSPWWSGDHPLTIFVTMECGPNQSEIWCAHHFRIGGNVIGVEANTRVHTLVGDRIQFHHTLTAFPEDNWTGNITFYMRAVSGLYARHTGTTITIQEIKR